MRRGLQAMGAAALSVNRSSSRLCVGVVGGMMLRSSVMASTHLLQQGRRQLHSSGVASWRGDLEQQQQQRRRPVGGLGVHVQQPRRSIRTLLGLAGRTAAASSVAAGPFPCPSPSSIMNRAMALPAGGARRSLATSPENNASAEGGGFATERDYHAAADEALEEVQALLEGLEDAVEDFEVNYSQGVLHVVMGEHGTWVLNKQTPNRQVWWSSPISGPLRFEYDADEGKWRTTRDRRELFALLAEEVRTVAGVDILEGQ